MGMGSKGRYALIGLAAAAGLGILLQKRAPADIRRFEYHPTLIEDAYTIFTDPMQLGIIGGAIVGALGVALVRAGDTAASRPGQQPGLLLNTTDPALVARAASTAEQATRQLLDGLKN